MKIFVSYSSKSESHIETVIEDLKNLGHQVWYDRRLSGGDVWWEKILDQIRNCDVFIFAQSSYTVDSEACKLELDYAVKLQRHILPIILEGKFSQYEIPIIISKLQYLDYRKKDKAAALELNSTLKKFSGTTDLPDPLPDPPPTPRIAPPQRSLPHFEETDLNQTPDVATPQSNSSIYLPLVFIIISVYSGFFGLLSASINTHVENSKKITNKYTPILIDQMTFRNDHEAVIYLQTKKLITFYPINGPAGPFLALVIIAYFFGSNGRLLRFYRDTIAGRTSFTSQSLILTSIVGGCCGLGILGLYYGLTALYPEVGNLPNATVLLFLCFMGGFLERKLFDAY